MAVSAFGWCALSFSIELHCQEALAALTWLYRPYNEIMFDPNPFPNRGGLAATNEPQAGQKNGLVLPPTGHLKDTR